MATGEGLYRQKTIDKLSSPDELSDYLKVANPSVWAILAAVVVLLVGLLGWACVGTLPTRADARIVVRDGSATVRVAEPYAVVAGMRLTVDDQELEVATTSTAENGEVVGHAQASLPDGTYDGTAVVDETRAIDFLLQSS